MILHIITTKKTKNQQHEQYQHQLLFSLVLILQLCYIGTCSFIVVRRRVVCVSSSYSNTCHNQHTNKHFHRSNNQQNRDFTVYYDRNKIHNRNGNHNKIHNRNKKGILIQTFRKAKQLEHTGDYIQAIRLLRKCLEIDSSDAHSYLALARIIRKLDGVESARIVFQSGLENCDNSNVHLLQAWATLEMRSNNTDAATKLFEQALGLDQSNPYVCHSYGLMSLGMGDIEKTRRLWHIPLNHDRASAALVCSLGELETNTGNLGE